MNKGSSGQRPHAFTLTTGLESGATTTGFRRWLERRGRDPEDDVSPEDRRNPVSTWAFAA
ncbi:MAG: hypothetical protein MZV64_29715 [Ignavibacteriales bacterium]|nr:hypothetical protein [Ignavibacteriales bacterium]